MFFCNRCGSDALVEFKIKAVAAAAIGTNIYPNTHNLVLNINNVLVQDYNLECASGCGSSRFYTYCVECDRKIVLESSNVYNYLSKLKRSVGNTPFIGGLLCEDCASKRNTTFFDGPSF